MSFTDNDLAQLKERKSSNTYRIFEMMGVEFDALVARLEAAEACIIPEELIGTLEEKYEAWLKAAGK